MDLHKRFQKLFFSENIGFSGGFQNNTNHYFSNITYELTNISYVDVFQNTCILRKPVSQGKSYSVMVAVYLCMNQTI